MMDQMMGGGMMWAMGLFGLLVIIVLVLGAVALVKYLFFTKAANRPTLRQNCGRRPTSARARSGFSHASIATTRIYDHRKTRPEDSPTFKVNY
jgi:hypothetical protein